MNVVWSEMESWNISWLDSLWLTDLGWLGRVVTRVLGVSSCREDEILVGSYKTMERH